jgi:hypothetical protein
MCCLFIISLCAVSVTPACGALSVGILRDHVKIQNKRRLAALRRSPESDSCWTASRVPRMHGRRHTPHIPMSALLPVPRRRDARTDRDHARPKAERCTHKAGVLATPPPAHTTSTSITQFQWNQATIHWSDMRARSRELRSLSPLLIPVKTGRSVFTPRPPRCRGRNDLGGESP